MAHDPLTAAWRAAQARATETRAVSLRALRDADPSRGTRFEREAVGLYFDFSRQRIDDDGLHLLGSLADAAGLRARIDSMWRGEIINTTEGRRAIEDSASIRASAEVHRVFYTTTLAAAEAVCMALQQEVDRSVRRLQDLHGRIKA